MEKDKKRKTSTMSLSTWPALTLAKIRNPREKLRNPTEMTSRRIDGKSKKSIDTSIVNTFETEMPAKVAAINSTIRSTSAEIKIVMVISTMKVADTTDSEKPKEKIRNTAIKPEIFPKIIDETRCENIAP